MALKATICGMDYSTKAIYTSFQQKSPETRAFTHTLKNSISGTNPGYVFIITGKIVGILPGPFLYFINTS